MKKGLVLVLVWIMLTGAGYAPVAAYAAEVGTDDSASVTSGGGGATALPFKDVGSKHWAKSLIDQAVAKGYVKGYADGTFKPDKSVTVAEFLAMLFLSMTEKDSGGNITWSQETLDRFPDHIRANRIDGYEFDFSVGTPWYINYLEISHYFGLVKELGEDEVKVPLIREQAATIVNHLDGYFNVSVVDQHAQLALLKIKDSKYISEEIKSDVGASVISGLLNGYPDGSWKPKKTITRAEAVSIIERCNNVSLRNPLKVDLSGVPYSLVPVYGFKQQLLMIFANWEMKKVHDLLVGNLSQYPGATLHDGPTFGYYENEERKNEDIQATNYIKDWSNHDSPLDIGISTNTNVYNIVLAKAPGRYERALEALELLLDEVFKSRSGEVRKLIDIAINDFREGKTVKVNTIIAKRQIIISSKGYGYTMVAAISAYADK